MLVFFFFNDTATTEIYTLSLHDALPISLIGGGAAAIVGYFDAFVLDPAQTIEYWVSIGILTGITADRKSTRLNSSHGYISYAVFCLKKKKKINRHKHQL